MAFVLENCERTDKDKVAQAIEIRLNKSSIEYLIVKLFNKTIFFMRTEFPKSFGSFLMSSLYRLSAPIHNSSKHSYISM